MKFNEFWLYGSLISATSVAATLLISHWSANWAAKPEVKTYSGKYSNEIRDEQQARTRAFLKEKGVENLRKSKVVVVGVGGVGSWVATMLARSGVGHITLVDFDQVSLSSLNRHACATLRDVGTSKVACLGKYLHSVVPWVEITEANQLWTLATGTQLLEGADYVVDCIDNLETKADLLAYCVHNKIPVVASMGAGTKADPTRITIGDISETHEDPLSRQVRIMLRSRGVTSGIPTIYSTEKPGKDKAQLLELDESVVDQGDVNELSVLKDFRVRILPVLGPMPAMFGLTIATHLLNVIGGYTQVFDPVLGGYSYSHKTRANNFEKALSNINGQFLRLGINDKTTHVSLEEIGYLMDEVWRGKTLNGEFTRQKLTLWDPKKPYDIHNMVVVNQEEQKRHEELVFRQGKPLEEVYTPEQIAHAEKRLALDRWLQQFRIN